MQPTWIQLVGFQPCLLLWNSNLTAEPFSDCQLSDTDEESNVPDSKQVISKVSKVKPIRKVVGQRSSPGWECSSGLSEQFTDFPVKINITVFRVRLSSRGRGWEVSQSLSLSPGRVALRWLRWSVKANCVSRELAAPHHTCSSLQDHSLLVSLGPWSSWGQPGSLADTAVLIPLAGTVWAGPAPRMCC